MIEIGQVFACIGICLVGLLVFLNKDKRADIFEHLRWVPLAFVLFNYRALTRTILEFYQGIGMSLRANDISWDVLHIKILVAQTKSMVDYGVSYLLLQGDPEALQALILGAITSGVTAIASVISAVVFVGIKAMSVIYLFVLIIFGPLNIGLSFIPIFSGMWKAWLQKFMSVCLWIPMLYLIDNFMLHVLDKLIDSLLSEGDANLGLVLTSGLLMLMNVFVYLKAPTLANFIVQGMNVSANQLKEQTKHYVKKAAQTTVDAKTGGATKGVRTLIQ
ncbi:type IV secretion system protein [Arenibacter sp. H213]|nr:type IV secretion system protein [Arenibacter sp. H213]